MIAPPREDAMAETDNSARAFDAPRPDHLHETRDERGLVLTYRWFSVAHVVLALFCVFWVGFLAFWYSTALSRNAGLANPMLWFPLLHVAVGLGLTYSALAGFVNRTDVVVGAGEITVRHGPLPWPGGKTVPSSEIVQLYREERASQTRNGRSVRYELNAMAGDGHKVRLLVRVPGPDVALYLEHVIERELGLADRRVPGEMRK